MLLAETSPAKFNIGRSAYYPYYPGASKKLAPREIWNGWHQPMIDFIKANIDVIAAWHYIAADWEVESEWNWAPIFAHCDARPWANAEFLEIWNHECRAIFAGVAESVSHAWVLMDGR